MTALVPRPDAQVVSVAGVPVVARAPAGSGWTEVWGIDPWQSPFAAWAGRLHLWVGALGSHAPPLVSADAVADALPANPSLDPWAHGVVGVALLVYLAALYLIGRRRAPVAGVVASLVVVGLALAGSARLAASVRARSTTLAEVTFLEQAPGTAIARAVTIGVVAVPYGGRYRLRAPRDDVISPVAASGNLRAEVTDNGTVLEGTLPAGAGARAFQAIGTARMSVRADLQGDSRLLLDLGAERVRRAEFHWNGRWYWLGDLPPGASAHTLDPGRWQPTAGSDGGGQDRAWLFRGQGADAIIGPTTPVLVGEIQHTAPLFVLADGGALGQRSTILLLPVERR